MEKVYNLMKGLDVSSATKIKGIPLHDGKYFPSAMIIIKALLNLSKLFLKMAVIWHLI